MFNIDLTNNAKHQPLWRKLYAKAPVMLVGIFLLCSGLFISLVTYKMGIMGVAAIVGMVVGIPLLYGIVAYPKFGIVVFLYGRIW
jgi:uncharacterized membrane protein (DUF485 family)